MHSVNHSLKKYNFLLISECSAIIVDLYPAESLDDRFNYWCSRAECLLVVKLFFTDLLNLMNQN